MAIIDDQACHIFLHKTGWAYLSDIPGDASVRRYSRVEKGGRLAVLMDCRALSADVPGIDAYIKVADWLRGVGLSAPEIYAVNDERTLMIHEDFGDVSFKAAIEQGDDEGTLYALAVDVLDHLKEQDPPNFLPRYKETRVHHLRKDIIDIWLPTIRGELNPPGLRDAYLKVWDDIEQSLSPVPHSFVHMDFHLENLMFLPGRDGLKRCGLIDIQDACMGPAPYDLANIMLNVRRSVPIDLQDQIYARYDDAYVVWMQVLAAQWHGRVLGLFTRLAHEGKPQYLQHLPRIYGYMTGALEVPELLPLKRFFDDVGVDFCLLSSEFI